MPMYMSGDTNPTYCTKYLLGFFRWIDPSSLYLHPVLHLFSRFWRLKSHASSRIFLAFPLQNLEGWFRLMLWIPIKKHPNWWRLLRCCSMTTVWAPLIFQWIIEDANIQIFCGSLDLWKHARQMQFHQFNWIYHFILLRFYYPWQFPWMSHFYVIISKIFLCSGNWICGSGCFKCNPCLKRYLYSELYISICVHEESESFPYSTIKCHMGCIPLFLSQTYSNKEIAHEINTSFPFVSKSATNTII